MLCAMIAIMNTLIKLIHVHVVEKKRMYINSSLIKLIISLVVSTVIIYSINFVAGFGGADYTFTHGEVFIIWILMAILVNNCLKK